MFEFSIVSLSTTTVTSIPIYYLKKLGFKTRNSMAMGTNCGLGLVRRTSSFGRKRVLILNQMGIDSEYVVSPMKKRSVGGGFSSERSLMEALPQDSLIKVICGVEHDDLKRLFHVSKQIREAVMIAKKLHFAYSTPKKVPAFRFSLDQSPGVDEVETPNAPRQSRVARSRLSGKKQAHLSVALFRDTEL
ncbi:hypothetical protein L1987_12579 [Smallanthus sonchifolius]|uniref:Uncharacterized protein n=1 Tax=Smallanthus sonchifolius TaxID=185202 RepID=A0ACB9JF39_9ASTR|nr:hypothetical protein L1987_12579 [Smallanthus sonchifolius]